MSDAGRSFDLTVVVPAFEEEAAIGASVSRLAAALADWPGGAEIIVVDDGSSDATFAAVEALLGRLPVPVRLHRHPENEGKGAAVRTGVIRARGRLVGFIDADLAYPPEVFHDFARAIGEGADVVVGRRSYPGSRPPLVRRLGHVAWARLIWVTLRPPVSDTQCGVKLFRGEHARALFGASRIDGFGFDFDVLRIADRWGLRVVEVDAPFTSLPAKSTVRLVQDSARMLVDLARARLRRVPEKPR